MAKFGDLMQEFFTSDPHRLLWFSRTMPASFWERMSRKRALETFHFVAERVPAYRDFLKKNGLDDHKKITTITAFTNEVPLSDKKSYITAYPVEQLVTREIPKLYTLSTSSGTTAQPTVWFRSYEQDSLLPRYLGALYRNVWQIDQHETLFVNTLALGSSNAGELVNFAIKQLSADPELSLTIATPGANVDQALATIRLTARHYDLILLGGYPSFIKLLFEEGVREGLEWPQLNIRLQTGGEAYSETWRKVVAEQVLPKSKRDSLDFHIDTYGSADAGGIGFGSPLTNLIRDLARENQQFCEALFGRPQVPTVVQYNPLGYFIETADRHLVITNRSAMPLVRYNTQDVGGIVPYEKLTATFGKFGYEAPTLMRKREVSERYAIWQYPLVYLYFRESSITVASANVYPANIAEIIEDSPEFNGFKLSKQEDEKGGQQFVIYLELKEGRSLTAEEKDELTKRYQSRILVHLRKKNLDFNQAYTEDPGLCEPKLVLHPFREGPFAEDGSRTKPRLVI